MKLFQNRVWTNSNYTSGSLGWQCPLCNSGGPWGRKREVEQKETCVFVCVRGRAVWRHWVCPADKHIAFPSSTNKLGRKFAYDISKRLQSLFLSWSLKCVNLTIFRSKSSNSELFPDEPPLARKGSETAARQWKSKSLLMLQFFYKFSHFSDFFWLEPSFLKNFFRLFVLSSFLYMRQPLCQQHSRHEGQTNPITLTVHPKRKRVRKTDTPQWSFRRSKAELEALWWCW